MRLSVRPFLWLLACSCLLCAPLAGAAGGAPFTVEDLLQLKRISDPQVSPDGHWLAFVERETDMAANKGHTSLWLLDLHAAGANPARITDAGGSDSSPRWGPDSRALYFLSARSGSSQVWRLQLRTAEAHRSQRFSAGRGLAARLAARRPPGAIAGSVPRLRGSGVHQAATGRGRQGQGERAHLRPHLRAPLGHLEQRHALAPVQRAARRRRQPGGALDLSRGFDADIPGKPFGGDEDYAFSPDGTHAGVRRAHRRTQRAVVDQFRPVRGARRRQQRRGQSHRRQSRLRTRSRYFLPTATSPGSRRTVPGFESDRFHVMLKRCPQRGGARRDRRLGSLGGAVRRHCRRPGTRGECRRARPEAAVRVSTRGAACRRPSPRPAPWTPSASARGEVIIDTRRPRRPGRSVLPCHCAAGGATPDGCEPRGARRRIPRPPTSSSASRAGTMRPCHGYVVKPYGFDAGQALSRSPSWCTAARRRACRTCGPTAGTPQTFAGGGYAVVMIDFHGSPGYGQAFTDSISRDWGGKPLEDLQKGLAAALQQYPWLDGERACALGASYGGFMMNWIEGNWPDRFRCIVNHDGVFDQRAMYYTTEELWFPEWEFGAPLLSRTRRATSTSIRSTSCRSGARRCWSSTASRTSASPTPGPRRLHGAAAARHREQAADLPGRESLGAEAGQQRAVVPHRARLAGCTPEELSASARFVVLAVLVAAQRQGFERHLAGGRRGGTVLAVLRVGGGVEAPRPLLPQQLAPRHVLDVVGLDGGEQHDSAGRRASAAARRSCRRSRGCRASRRP